MEGGETFHVLSNDNYDKYIQEGSMTAEWRNRHVIKYCWIRGQLRLEANEFVH